MNGIVFKQMKTGFGKITQAIYTEHFFAAAQGLPTTRAIIGKEQMEERNDIMIGEFDGSENLIRV